MNLQYISDTKGKTTGVFIPINDWKYLKNRYKEIEQDERETFEVPEWEKQIIDQMLKDCHDNPNDVMDWEDVQKIIKEKYGY